MDSKRISKDDLDDLLENQIDPLGELPPGFPSSHSRFPATPSYAFVEENSQDVEVSGSLSPETVAAAKTEIRAALTRYFPHIR
jgi:hypothetical protein